MIIIKKYPNRRLYDTSKSQYINLGAIEALVRQQQEFKVIDSRSEKDLTHSILLQIVNDQESSKEQTILSQAMLRQLIVFYGGNMQPLLSQYLEQCMAMFVEQQDSFTGVLQDFVDHASPDTMVREMVTSIHTTAQEAKLEEENDSAS